VTSLTNGHFPPMQMGGKQSRQQQVAKRTHDEIKLDKKYG